ncbi:MAG TPA: SIS domain-containing protein [Iamia sp.]|nr:SIS domain-containing protein [Iamia sp.]
MSPAPAPVVADVGRAHLDRLRHALDLVEAHLPRVGRWGAVLHDRLAGGGRLLVAGNGGSAAQAQHLAAELVGRYHDERPPFSAVALTADTSTVTALANDYGVEELFARQVEAHGRPGDVLLCLSTSGRSPNVVRAADRARARGLETWALTGAPPSPLARASVDAVAVGSDHTATVQEVHQVLIHLLCEAFDARMRERSGG